MILDGQSIVVTGGTGSFGRAFVGAALFPCAARPRRLSIFSRDEWKQSQMESEFGRNHYPCLRYRLGDVRSYDRLLEVFRDTDIVVHAAAQKQVPASENNPFEAVSTNVMGTQNVIRAAIERGVKKVILLSTDKAVDPINLYGATKMVAEKLIVDGNIMSGQKTLCSAVRYGNVFGSRGSVVPLWVDQRKSGKITVTDPDMTRFWIPLKRAVRLVIHALEHMKGGEIFIPRLEASTIGDLADVIAPGCWVRGEVRPGEKMHESLISKLEDGHIVSSDDDTLAILPNRYWYTDSMRSAWNPALPHEWTKHLGYTSGNDGLRMSREELGQLFSQYMEEHP